MNNIIDSIQLSGTVYTLSAQTEGGGVPESTFTAYTASTDSRISIDEEVTAAGLNALNDAIQEKQDQLSAGTNITIVDNVISAEGGGKAIEAGRGISVTTGETADTVSFNLPISAGTGNYSIIEGGSTTASGHYSHAEGNYARASGNSSHAEGINTNASSTASHAEGNSTTANGITSHAEGQSTIASGYYSHTEGQQTSASSFAAHAEGINTNAIGQSSHAEGNRTKAIGNSSHAEGQNTTASGHYSHAEGYYSKANGSYSHAEGGATNANGDNSHAEGSGTETKNDSEHASGQFNISSSASTTFGDSGNTLFSVGNGTANNARHNAFEIRQNGDIYITKDGQDVKLQDQLGGSSITVDTALDSGSTNPVENRVIYNKIDEVEQVTAAALNELNDAISGKVDTSTYSTYTAATDTALASKQTTLSAGTGISIVDNVISATGGGGKAIEAGRGIAITTGETADTVSFNLPISAGTNNLDNITCCGSNTTRGQYAVSFGNGNTAKGGASLTFGRNCLTNSYDNVAGGFGVTTKGNQASSFGQYTKTENEAEHSVGRYNVSNKANGTFGNSGNTLFSVGNGTADNARHNAFEIRQNGDIYCSDGTNDVKLQDTITATAANTTALGGLSLVKLTQTEYNNLQTKDNNTLYIIVN